MTSSTHRGSVAIFGPSNPVRYGPDESLGFRRVLTSTRYGSATPAFYHDLEVLREIPFDDELRRGDHRRLAPLDTNASAIGSMEKLVDLLRSKDWRL